jgi:hypothetical protein
MSLSGCMASCRMRQKTKKESAEKALANVRKEMARPRVAESAQKKVTNTANNGFSRRD